MTTPEVRRPEGVPHQNGLEQTLIRYQQSHLFSVVYSDNTRAAYGSDLAQFQEYCRARNILSVSQLTPEDFINWHNQLRQDGYAPATINRKRASSLGFFDWAQAEGIIRPDFTKSFPRYESPGKKQLKILSTEQVDKLISNAGNLRDASLILITLGTGASITEIINLNTEDISITADGNIAIRFKGGVRKTQPRTLEIDKYVGSEIAEYIEDSRLKPEDPLFQSHNREGISTGHRLTRQGVNLILKGYTSKIGIENLNPRMLRDTFIADFAGNPHELTEVLGRNA